MAFPKLQVRKLYPDPSAQLLGQKFAKQQLQAVTIIQNYTITKSLTAKQKIQISQAFLSPNATAASFQDFVPKNFHFVTEISFLPGVTDNLGQTARSLISDLLKQKFCFPQENVFASKRYFWTGAHLTRARLQQICQTLFNPLIEVSRTVSAAEFRKSGLFISIPRVQLPVPPKAPQLIDLEIADPELTELGQRGIRKPDGTYQGPLALNLAELKTIRKYARQHQRKITAVELETLAQTWSEHCKHKIFASPLDEIKAGLYQHFIQKTTAKIRKKKGQQDFCVSVFHDNSGAIIFDENYLLTDKVETHNSPSALDPFGGALTGIVGVNRDCLGFGRAAKPIANRYGFCVGALKTRTKLFRDHQCQSPVLSPRQILAGVVAGIRSGGNKSGIPTTQGFLFFDPRYRGKPLVFAGTVGLIPRKICGQFGHAKKAQPGDYIVTIGGRVGVDGLHGATFSSESLHAESPATAVQIGDPFTQKKISDALIREARPANLFNSITDCGAGGLSSAVAEMAQEAGGCRVDLAQVPQKYPNLTATEIWLAESQERLVLAVPPRKFARLQKLMTARAVEIAKIGKFTRTPKCLVYLGRQKVLDLAMNFLHQGWPRLPQFSRKPPVKIQPKHPKLFSKLNLKKDFLNLVREPNLASRAFLARQFDHEVQGSSVLKPLSQQVDAPVSVLKPLPNSPKAILLTSQLFPHRTELDPRATGLATVEAVVAQITAAGGNPDYLALLDNFCWCSSKDPERLWQLKETARGLSLAAEKFGTPLISGKDSMFNDFRGFTAGQQLSKIFALPTLLVSGLGVLANFTQCVSLEPKFAGDEIWLLGLTKKEFGGSAYAVQQKIPGGEVPQIDLGQALKIYRKFYQATQKKLIASSLALVSGGLALALTKKVLGSKLGLKIDLAQIPSLTKLMPAELLFSESGSRLLFSVNPQNSTQIAKLFGNLAQKIGVVTQEPNLVLNTGRSQILQLRAAELRRAYTAPLKNC